MASKVSQERGVDTLSESNMSVKIHFLMQYPDDSNDTGLGHFKEDYMRTRSDFSVSFSHITNIY